MNVSLSPAHLDVIASLAWAWSLEFVPRFVSAALLLAAGAIVANWTARLALRVMGGAGHVDPTLRTILASVVRYMILVLVLVAALSQIGVQTASLLAVLGAAGLAIGLALQGTLANIAAGIMLVWLRPFRVGDYIEVVTGNPIAGTVREIGLFASLVQSYDGIMVFAPNSTIWNSPVRNHSRTAQRLVCVSISLPETADIPRARDRLLAWLAQDLRVSKSPATDIFLERIDDGAATLTCRLWTSPSDLGAVQRDLISQAMAQLQIDDAQVLPSHIFRVVPPDSDPSRLIGEASSASTFD